MYKPLVQMTPEECQTAIDDTIARRNVGRDWMRTTFWEDFAEAYRMYKCRVQPIINPRTNKEDLTRSNLSMPDAWIAIRRKTARMTSRQPHIPVRAESDDVGNWLTAYLSYQWDYSNEQKEQVRHVLQGNLFGVSLKVYWWNEIQQMWRFRERTDSLIQKRGLYMDEAQNQLSLATEEQFQDGQARPAGDFSDEQQAQVMAGLGDEQFTQRKKMKYSGPQGSFVFVGDWMPEPEFPSIQGAAWHIFEWNRDLDWLKYWVSQTYKWQGEEFPCFDEEQVKKLIDEGSWTQTAGKDQEFKENLRQAIFKAAPQVDVRLLPNKRFKVTQECTIQDGWPWVRFLGNERFILGQYPLPYDLGGFPISSFTPIPDLLYEIGDSSPRVLKHLLRLHNVTVSQCSDLMTNVLKKLVLVKEDADLPSEIVDLGLLRVLRVKSLTDFKFDETVARMPPEAWQFISMIVRQIQMAEPSMIDFGEQSQALPASSKVATLGLLQEKASEGLATSELERLNEDFSDGARIKLQMLQQAMSEGLELPDRFFKGMALTQGGEVARQRRMEPWDLQETFECFPVLGSTLALDDMYRKSKALEAYQVAVQNPSIWNVRAAAKQLAETYGEEKAQELILPEPEGPPAPPEPKLNISVAVKFESLPGETRAEIIQKLGMRRPASLEGEILVEGIEQANRAGKAAEELTRPIPPPGVEGSEEK